MTLLNTRQQQMTEGGTVILACSGASIGWVIYREYIIKGLTEDLEGLLKTLGEIKPRDVIYYAPAKGDEGGQKATLEVIRWAQGAGVSVRGVQAPALRDHLLKGKIYNSTRLGDQVLEELQARSFYVDNPLTAIAFGLALVSAEGGLRG